MSTNETTAPFKGLSVQETSLLNKHWRKLWICAAFILFILLGIWNLSAPPMWWDEGWTLSVARNWVERGHYGRLQEGQPAPPGLEASFTYTAWVALSFKLFGVGIWQGRLPGVLFTAAALALLYALTKRLYSHAIAIAALAVVLLLPMHPQLHPLITGRQVLAEMPMFCYLLMGYLGLLLALQGSVWYMIGAVLWWGIALITKAQALPFWAASLIIPLAVTLVSRQWRTAVVLGLGLVGSYGCSRGLLFLIRYVLQEQTLPATAVIGLYEITAFVMTAFNRLFALKMTLIWGLPTFAGLVFTGWSWLQEVRARQHHEAASIVRLSLLMLTASWYVWFVLFSVGVPRYLFPAIFFGSIFLAALLFKLTGGFNLAMVLMQSGAAVRQLRLTRQRLGALLAILIITTTLPLTFLSVQRYYLNNSDFSASETADFLNTHAQADAVIETYESELHFLLHRRYHFPPDQAHVELNRRSLLGIETTVDYDALAADPDYLVVGEFAKGNALYKDVLQTGQFRLAQQFGVYDIYQRVR
ncbi:MAG: hypothetical protein CYG59_09220 [Chloroflexi bacterium]|nr:MAG: hypothetical protein CYG59_09220 [Chloroflexota bacterium]